MSLDVEASTKMAVVKSAPVEASNKNSTGPKLAKPTAVPAQKAAQPVAAVAQKQSKPEPKKVSQTPSVAQVQHKAGKKPAPKVKISGDTKDLYDMSKDLLKQADNLEAIPEPVKVKASPLQK